MLRLAIVFFIFSLLLFSSCVKQEVQSLDRSEKLFTYYVKTSGLETTITYKLKDGYREETAEDELWHHTFPVNLGDTIEILVTSPGSLVDSYVAYDGKITHYTNGYYVQPTSSLHIAYIIDF